tara:strand:+ start:433 stop:765 length:333 start_codon:yes stop_codon:yes gene_type:complete
MEKNKTKSKIETEEWLVTIERKYNGKKIVFKVRVLQDFQYTYTEDGMEYHTFNDRYEILESHWYNSDNQYDYITKGLEEDCPIGTDSKWVRDGLHKAIENKIGYSITRCL